MVNKKPGRNLYSDRSGNSNHSHRLRVLLAAPKSKNRSRIEQALSSANMHVTTVSSGRDCVSIALAAELLNPYDLVIASLQLQDLDGFSVTMLLRDNGYSLPIATLEGKPFYLHEENSREAGSDIHFCSHDSGLISAILENCSAKPEQDDKPIAA